MGFQGVLCERGRADDLRDGIGAMHEDEVDFLLMRSAGFLREGCEEAAADRSIRTPTSG
jgi:hypothetical protein